MSDEEHSVIVPIDVGEMTLIAIETAFNYQRNGKSVSECIADLAASDPEMVMNMQASARAVSRYVMDKMSEAGVPVKRIHANAGNKASNPS